MCVPVCIFCSKNCQYSKTIASCKICDKQHNTHLSCATDHQLKSFVCTPCLQSNLPFFTLNDGEFAEALEIQNLLMKEIDDNLAENIDNFFIKNSSYFSSNELNSLLKQKGKNDLAIIHFNTRSLPKNKFHFECLLAELKSLPEIIAITETKINANNLHLTELDHYEFVHVDSKSAAGGVGLYIRDD